MLVLTDTGDLEPDLDISKRQCKVLTHAAKDLQENSFAGSFYLVIRYNEF